MRRVYLLGCATIVLLGGCGSSDDGSVDAKPQPKYDAVVSNPRLDTAPAGLDTGTPSTGVDTGAQVKLDSGLSTGIDASGTVKLDGAAPVVDGGIDSGVVSGPDGKLDVGVDGNTDTGNMGADAPLDAATPDAAIDVAPDTVEASKPVYDGGLAGSCIKGLFGTYVLRWDGSLIDETIPASPQTVFEASTGLPLSGVVDMTWGAYHGCALLENGTVNCWQNNASLGNADGQLGNGTTTAISALYRATPVLTGPAAPLSHVVAMAPATGNNWNSCAVTDDHRLWCWGNLTWAVNKGKVLSTGYAQAITTDGQTPLTGVVSAAQGPAVACAIVDGAPKTVWCWGGNSSGELGQGDTTDRQYPTRVLGLSNPTEVAISWNGDASNFPSSTVCALDDQKLKCWGHNGFGQVGANVATNFILSPTTVVVQAGSALDGVSHIVQGLAAFAVLRGGNSIWEWGNEYQRYAANYGQTNVLAIGWAGVPNGPRFLTSDGVYHKGASTVAVNCNAL